MPPSRSPFLHFAQVMLELSITILSSKMQTILKVKSPNFNDLFSTDSFYCMLCFIFISFYAFILICLVIWISFYAYHHILIISSCSIHIFEQISKWITSDPNSHYPWFPYIIYSPSPQHSTHSTQISSYWLGIISFIIV